jgi:hypothetical protein
MCPWIDALSEEVRLPFLHFSQADLAACRDEDVIQDSRAMLASAEATCEVVPELPMFRLHMQKPCHSKLLRRRADSFRQLPRSWTEQSMPLSS